MVERAAVSQNEILAKSLQLAHAKERRALDIESAKQFFPSLQNKLHEFIDSKLPDDSHLRISKKLTPEELEAGAKAIKDLYFGRIKPARPPRTREQIEREKKNAVRLMGKIPIGNEFVTVTIERGCDISIYESGNSTDLTIRVQDLPYFYTLNRGRGMISSTAEKPLPRGGPYGGPAYRSLPEWTREWRTSDIENVSNLIDVLSEDTAIVEAKEIRVYRSIC